MKRNQDSKQKVRWNRSELVEVIYECYVPLDIRNSSSLVLKHFTNRFVEGNMFVEGAEKYIKDIMRRKSLSRVTETDAVSNERGIRNI
jgi:hypothetical protein